MSLIKLDNVKKHFYRRSGLFFGETQAIRAVDGVSLEIIEGETFALVGESGSGKSTLGRLILGLLEPTSGEIWFDGASLSTASEETMRHLRPQMQMVFQDPFSSLNPRKSVYDTIAQPLNLHTGLRRGELAERVYELLTEVRLTPPEQYVDRYPHELSGGQRQRVALARALAPGPRLIIADEPVASLDVSVQAQILTLLHEMKEKLRVTILFITHDLGVVRSVADRVAVMYLGQIMEMGLTDEVLQQPQCPYTQVLLESTPIADPKLARERDPVRIPGEIPSPSNPPSGCRFHTRCPLADTAASEYQQHGEHICMDIEPELLSLDEDWLVRCHLVHDPFGEETTQRDLMTSNLQY